MTSVTVSTINELSAAWAPLLWKASWQGGVALLLILVITRAVRKVPAHVQCWLWRLAFVKLLIAGLWIIPVELRWLPPAKSTTSETRQAAFESVREAIPVQFDAASRLIPRPEHSSQLSPLSWLMIAWMAGVVLFLANLVRHWAQLRKMTSSLELLTDERVRKSLAESCHQLGLIRQPELRVLNKSGSPFLIGIVRPVVVLPTIVLKACSADELNAALIHELAHIRRRDLLWNWLPALAEAMFFFHPLIWLVRKEWRLAQESATDELAVSVPGVCLATYANSLVELAAKCSTVAIRPHLALAASETYSQLSRRMIAMQTFQKHTRGRRLATAVVVFTIAVLGAVPWKLTARETPAEPVLTVSTTEQASKPDASQENEESPSRTITIRVVDPKGKPMKGVKVFRNHVYKLEGVERPKIENDNFWTDSEGTAVVTLSGTSVDLRLWATKKNFVPLHAMWAKQFQSDGEQIPDEFTFQLQHGTTIGGVVTNEKGEPIEDVTVEVLDRAAERFHVATINVKPGKRPMISQWLAEDESAILTDARGRWELGNVPPEKMLEFDNDTRDRHLRPRILLRLSHPKYVSDSKWGRLQSEQNITDELLRNQTATIIMKRDAETEPDR